MITFIVAVIILLVGYFVYSRIAQRIFGINDNRLTPAIASPDGVDKVPLNKWKAFLIETLNIAGTGPIFGAISGALFGPIVFLWIVLGSILGGAVHDYMTGMISCRNDGNSIAEISKKYVGNGMKWIMRIFSIVLLILVTSVFVVSPSSLLESLTDGNVKAYIWLIIILAYYFFATIFPVDKIIGKVYPAFAVLLIGMAIATLIAAIVNINTSLLDIIGNFRDFSLENGGLPWWPFMLTTVACGAVSGFHATHSPIMAKCIKKESDGRIVFYFAMITESIIALIWAAAAMAYYKVDTADGWQLLNSIGGSSTAVYQICTGLLGPVGSALAILGVIICPITSGDTSLRSCRLIVAEIFHLDQSKIRNRIIITLPIFMIVIIISIWDFLSPSNFNILWRWFAWSNQVLACSSFWVATIYLMKRSRYKWGSLLTAIPAMIMEAVVVAYILGEPHIAFGRYIPITIAYIIGGSVAVTTFIIYLIFQIKHLKNKSKVVID